VTTQRSATLYICASTVLLPILVTPGIEEFALLPRLLALSTMTLVLTIHVLAHRTAKAWAIPDDLLLCLAAFWGMLALSVLWAHNPFRSTYDLAKHIPAFAMFLLLCRHLPKENIPQILVCYAGSGLLVSILGILEYFGISPIDIPSTGRPSATFAFRNLAGAYLATGIPLTLVGYPLCESRWQKRLSIAAGFAMTTFLFYTRARASWFGLLAGLGCSGCLWMWVRIRAGKLPSVATVLRLGKHPIFLVLLLAILAGQIPDRLGETHRQRFDEKKSSMATALLSMTKAGGDRGRFEMWLSTLDLIGDHWLMGVGLGNWEYVYPPYDGGVQIQATSSPHRPHNDLLWIWSETGTLGLLAYLGLLWVLFRRCRDGVRAREDDDPHLLAILASLTGMVAFLGVGMFSFPFERVPTEFNFWLSASILYVLTRDEQQETSRAWIPLLGLLLAASCLITIKHIAFDWHYARAYRAFLQKDYTAAASQAEKALGYGPFDHQAFVIAGEGAYKSDRWDDAEAYYREALGYHPNFANAYNGLGLAEYGRGNHDAAFAYFNKTLSMVPKHHNALHNRALIFEFWGEMDSALVSYEKAIRGDHAAPLVNMGALYRKAGMVDSAISAYTRATVNPIPAVEAWFNLGSVHLDNRDFARSGQAFLNFLANWTERDSVWASARSGLAQSYSGYGVQLEQAGKVDSALVFYQNALEMEPESHLNWFNLGNALRANNRMPEAVKAYERALNIDDQHIDSYNNLGMTYRDLKRDGDAIEVYRRAHGIAPANPIVNYNLGQALMVGGKREEADRVLAVFRENWQDDPQLIDYYMGNVYAQSGMLPEARAAYRAFLEAWDKPDGVRQSAERILESITPAMEP